MKNLNLQCLIIYVMAFSPSMVSGEELAQRAWIFDRDQQGWRAANDCHLTIDAGHLVIQSTGADPFLEIELQTLLPSGWIQLRLEGACAATGDGQLFWRTANATGFSEALSAPYKIAHDGEQHTYSITFYADSNVTGLRLDPARGVGTINVKSIRLICSSTPPPIDIGPIPSGLDTFFFWQLPSQTGTQIMSYVIRTQGGKTLVVDGGMPRDATYLKRFLANFDYHVDAWILSHPHIDHVGALTAILGESNPPTIDKIYASLPSAAWLKQHEPNTTKTLTALTDSLKAANITMTRPALGDNMVIDGVRIEILGVHNPELMENACNNSSLVWRMSDVKKSVLFLGDLGVEGGRKIAASPYFDRLQSDYVQMSHHGQAGVDRDFYRAVAPTHCLWPTPDWLWDVDNGGGKGSGPWATLAVRAWMETLGVNHHHVMKDGLLLLGVEDSSETKQKLTE